MSKGLRGIGLWLAMLGLVATASAGEGGVGWISWKIVLKGTAPREVIVPTHARQVARKLLLDFYEGHAIVHVPYEPGNVIFVYSLRYLYDPRTIERKDDVDEFLRKLGETDFRVERSDFGGFVFSTRCQKEGCRVSKRLDGEDMAHASYLYAEAARRFGYPVSGVLFDAADSEHALTIHFYNDCAFRERMAEELEKLTEIIKKNNAGPEK